jgi:ZIP family zinc transporter
MHELEELHDKKSKKDFNKLYRVGLFTALAITIHNFPEGMATFFSALKSIELGIPIAVAIAIHNIPEGVAVSIPIYYSTGSRVKAFCYSFLSGLAEPLGALCGYFILSAFMSPVLFGVLFAMVAGIMVYISLDELLPSAEKYGNHHLTILGAIFGMFVMALSLLAFL